MKEFADNNFKYDENGRNISKQVENNVGKGEIARYEQFLLFPQCFFKVVYCRLFVPKISDTSIDSLYQNSHDTPMDSLFQNVVTTL